jgi:hypothetical protein
MFGKSYGGFLIGSALVATLIAAPGCLVDDEETPGTGGTGATGGSAQAGMSGSAGSMAGSSSTDMCVVGAPANQCSGMGVPVDGVLIDFSTFTSTGTWGIASAGDLTGGTSLYRGPDMASPTITNTPDGTGLKMSVLIPSMGYAGDVFWFGPCVNTTIYHDDTQGGMPTNYTGISFSVGGVTNGAKLSVQVQTHGNYPVDGSKGGCTAFTDCATRWDTCVGPKTEIEIPEAVTKFDLPWSSFTGGSPTAAVTPEALVGLQFQIECQSDTECQVDMTLSTISFLTTP